MARKLRVSHLAQQLGMTNAEVLELCRSLGVNVKDYASSLPGHEGDRVRLAAQRRGATRRDPGNQAGEPEVVRSARPGQATRRPETIEGGSLRALASSEDLVHLDLVELATRVGIAPRDINRRLDAIGTARANREIRALLDAQAAMVEGWRSVGVGEHEIQAWIDVGFSRPDEAQPWCRAGFDPARARLWRDRGFSNPALVSGLLDRGVDVDEIDGFIQRGGSSIGAARWLISDLAAHPVWPTRFDWCAAGLRPDEAVEWFSFSVEPAVARAFKAAGLQPLVATAMRQRGASLELVAELIELGVPVPELETWAASGVASNEAAPWSRAGFDPSLRAEWSAVGIDDPATAAAWHSAIADTTEYRSWQRVGFTEPADAAAWRAAEFTPRVAHNWNEIGVADPKIAQQLRGRLQLRLVGSLLAAGFHDGEVLVWANYRTSTGLLELLVSTAEKHPDVVRSWRGSSNRISDWPYWMPFLPDTPTRAAAWKRAGLDPQEVKLISGSKRVGFHELGDWLAQGKDLSEFLMDLKDQNPQSPATPQPVRVPADGEPFEKWLRHGSNWIDSARARRVDGRQLLRELFERDRSWAALDEYLFDECADGYPTISWLEEIVAHAENVQPQLRRSPEWPVVYESEAVTIDLTVHGRLALAWVGNDRGGILVSFSTTTFDVWYQPDDLDARFAVGLALSWFLDCCIGLTRDGSHPHLRRQGAISTGSKGSRPNGVVYAPTPSFDQHFRSIRRGSSSPPRAHRVIGHVRHLSDVRTPSYEARSNAPAHVRLTMGPQDTFVRSHSRGGDEAALRLVRRLREYSSLADALGTSQRY